MGEGGGKVNKWTHDWRTLTGFWLLGMCNNFGYVVMLSAAHDLLSGSQGQEDGHTAPPPVNNGTRECNYISTGAILLADIVPSVIIKLVSPFFPLWIHTRVAVTIVLGAGGFALVASNAYQWTMVLGVVLTSLASGLGESSLLMYMPFFKNKNVISTWSSGTGGAGVLGSLSYLGLIAAGLDPSTTIYMMLVVPLIMAISFWVLLERPKIEKHSEESVVDDFPIAEDETSLSSKFKLIYKITIVYMLPFALVYVFEYFINQGLFELIYYEGIFIDHAMQYRWYSFDYQIGVLISRSTVNLVQIDNTWLLTVFQAVNVVIMTTEAIYHWIGQFWVVIVLILWEGLLGGCSYVNTYRRINKEMPPSQRQFSMSMNSFGDAIGITLAGIIAIPVHNAICKLPPP